MHFIFLISLPISLMITHMLIKKHKKNDSNHIKKVFYKVITFYMIGSFLIASTIILLTLEFGINQLLAIFNISLIGMVLFAPFILLPNLIMVYFRLRNKDQDSTN